MRIRITASAVIRFAPYILIQLTTGTFVKSLRAWSFGGISRFDAAFLLLWLAAAIFRFGFIVRAVRLLCERLAEGPVNAEAAR